MENLEDQLRRMIVSGNPPQQHYVPPPNAPNDRFTERPPVHFNAVGQRTVDANDLRSVPPADPHGNVPYTSRPPGLTGVNGVPFERQPPQPHQGQMSGQHRASNRRPSYGANDPAGSNIRHMPPTRPTQLDPNSFDRHGMTQRSHQTQSQPSIHQRPHGPPAMRPDYHVKQAHFLENLASHEVPPIEMGPAERQEKDAFRAHLQTLLHRICVENPDRFPTVALQCFGSFQTGFATAGSDMDLVIVSQGDHISPECFSLNEHSLPRALEKVLLQEGHGARLLTRTRVPIIKICQSPDLELLSKLREERDKWDHLPEDEKYPLLNQEVSNEARDKTSEARDSAPHDGPETAKPSSTVQPISSSDLSDLPQTPKKPTDKVVLTDGNVVESQEPDQRLQKTPGTKVWTRHRQAGPLDFPSHGVGIQCDINFFNPLGLHNTQLLRCYTLCDPRVHPMVLFVKSWAKKRKINSSYSGTLSSYGYVLMVLHYLVNIVQPPVLPNLQSPWRPGPGYTPHGAHRVEVDGWNVDFWRNEEEITDALRRGLMTPNRESLGGLLAGFFNYYSSQGSNPQFHWMQECLSLRTQGGIVTKDEKGWTRATTEEGEGKRVQHRYLFCIEDPFELSHNVARTVTHNGIVAIRDEFRRARRILHAIGCGFDQPRDGELFAAVTDVEATVQVGPPPKHNNRQGSEPHTPSGEDRIARTGHSAGSYGRGAHQRHPQRGPPIQPSTPSKAPNVADNEAFPALGSARRPKPRGAAPKTAEQNENFSEVSGQRAQALLEDIKRRKLEEEAEVTATGAANAVLDGFD